ncbi:hypothetical protein ACFL50_03835 [Candidatus Latescibacterota bacterium]
MKINLPVAVISAVLLLSHQPVGADMGPVLGIGKTIRPRTDTSVRMASETVDILIDGNIAYVNCLFELTNDGPPDTLEVGFPLGMNVKKKDNEISEMQVENLGQDFSVRCNRGLPLSITQKRFDPSYTDESGLWIKEWVTFTVPFTAKGQTNKISTTYWVAIQPKYNKLPLSDLLFKYVLVTGAYWKGTISDAKITVKLRNTTFDKITYISPEGYDRDNAEISWYFTDFEPTEDIELYFMQNIAYDRLNTAQLLLQENPNNAHAHFLRGTVIFNRGIDPVERQKSLREFELAVENDPEHWDARWFLALHYMQQPEKLREQLEAIITGNPDYRCTDEAYFRRPSGDPTETDNPKNWLDFLKNRQ